MPKRRLNSIRLDKIAAVDLPCQEHATVAFVKRAPSAAAMIKLDARYPLVKATYEEALNGAMVSERVNRAFWDSFDGLWQRNDAFRTALTDELADGGDGSAASADYVASVNELVDEAVAAARSAGAKASDDEMSKAIGEAATSWLAKQTPQPKEQTMKITTKAQLKTAVAAFDIAKSSFADAQAITDAAVALDATDELPADSDLAKMASDKKKKGDPNADKTMKSLQREVAVLKMAPAIRKHFDGLAEDAQDAFIAKSDAERQAEVDAVDGNDPVVHKCLDGTEIRKSAGPAMLAMAKRADNLSKEIGALRETSAGDAIEKRARTEFGNVALAEATDMLKAASEVGEDSVAGKAILKTLATMNKGRDTLFKSLGTTEAPGVTGDIKKARQDFDSEVSKVAREDKIGMADAMSKVRNERPDLFEAAYPETAAADEDA
jgi:hypothetical protein